MFDTGDAELALRAVIAVQRAHEAGLSAWHARVSDPLGVDPLDQWQHDDDGLAADGAPPSRAVDGPDALAGQARRLPPGPASAALLAGIRVGGLSPAGRLDYLAAQQRLASWVESLAVPVLTDHAGLEARANHPYDERQRDRYYEQVAAVTEIAGELKVSERTMGARIRTARLLVGRLPLTLDALRTGHLTTTHVRAIVDLVEDCDPDVAAAVEQRVVPGCVRRGGAGTPSSFRRSCRLALVDIDAGAIADRHEVAVQQRGVTWFPLPDGMAGLEIRSTALDIDVVMRSLTALAGPRDATDPRTLDNRRVDALVAMCSAGTCPADSGAASSSRSTLGARSRPRPDVQAQVVVDLATLLGLADHPAELRGYGAIPADVARAWLTDATTWRRLVTDPVTGHLLDMGPQVRFAPEALRSFVVARDATCTFPGCNASAAGCDIDHRVPHRREGEGGSTSAANCDALCRRHHNLKTTGHWQVVASHPDRVVWRSPNGRLHARHRPPVLPRWAGRHGPPIRNLEQDVEIDGPFHRASHRAGRSSAGRSGAARVARAGPPGRRSREPAAPRAQSRAPV